MSIRSHFNRGLVNKGLSCNAPSLAQRHLLRTTDINDMVRRAFMGDRSVFRQTQYLDVLNAPESYHDAFNRLKAAQSLWDDMPDRLKAAYGSPDRLLAAYDSLKQELASKPSEFVKTDVVTGDKKSPDGTSTVPAHAENNT